MEIWVGKTICELVGSYTDLRLLYSAFTDREGEVPFGRDGKFYTGLLKRVLCVCDEEGIEVELTDPKGVLLKYLDPVKPEPVFRDMLPGVELRDYQVLAIRKSLIRRRGVVKIPTGAGKTEVIAGVVKLLEKPTVIVASGISGMDVLLERFKKYQIYDVGYIGDQRRELGRQIVVGVADSLANGVKQSDAGVLDLLRRAQVLIFDECHHVGCQTWLMIGASCGATYRLGFSATPFSSRVLQTRDYQLIGQTGEVLIDVPPNYLIERGWLAKPVIDFVYVTKNRFEWTRDWHLVYKQGVVHNNARNEDILRRAKIYALKGRKCLILVKELKHGGNLLRLSKELDLGLNIAFFDARGHKVYGRNFMKALEERRVIIASPILKEAVNLPTLGALVLAGGGQSLVGVLQQLGRGMRPNEFGNLLVTDYYDTTHPYLRKHSRKRAAEFREEGHLVMGAPFTGDRIGMMLLTQGGVITWRPKDRIKSGYLLGKKQSGV